MEEIVFVTHNKGKIAAAKKHLEKVNFTVYDYELQEPRSDDLQVIATAKVKEAYELVHKPCIALDAGFFIEELNGFPRAFVNFALDTIGVKGILKLMEGKENRTCYFRECLAYHDGNQIRYFYGEHKGQLTTQRKGEDRDKKWSDLWYVYIPQNHEKTLAQMNDEEREERRKTDGSKEALKEFANWYLQNKGEEK